MKRSIIAAAIAALLAGSVAAFAQFNGGSTGAVIGGDGSYIFKVLPMASGSLLLGQGATNDPQVEAMSGDCSINASGAVTCTKTNGTNFGTAAAAATGTSGNTLGALNANKTDSGANIYSGLNTFSGHIAAGSSSPTLSSCGSGSPAIVGDDKDGQVTMGTSATGCTITFAAAYTSAPLCVVQWQATPLASQSWSVSTTAITTTQTSTSTNKLNYHCTAQNGG